MTTKMSMKLVVVLMVVAIAWLGVPTMAATTSTSCLTKISKGCNITDTSSDSMSQVDKCCTALTDAIDNQIQCFCLLQSELAKDPSNADSVKALFNYCSIKGSMDSLCGSTDESSTTPTVDGTSPADDTSTSSDDAPATSSPGSNTGGGLGGLMGGKGEKNSGSKTRTTSLFGLLIISITIVIMHGI